MRTYERNHRKAYAFYRMRHMVQSAISVIF